MPAFAADRLTDRDVKELVARIEDDRDKFDNALDDELKNKILRDSTGEVDVKRFLNNFQESIDRLEASLKPGYAGSTEAGTLLRQGSALERYFRAQPGGTKGESEWNRLASELKLLAAVYGAEFPVGENATFRRIGDKEVVDTMKLLEESAQQLKKSLDSDLKKDPSVDSASREAIVQEADQLSKDAKVLRDRVNDGKPSSAEADQVMKRAAKLHDVHPGAQGADRGECVDWPQAAARNRCGRVSDSGAVARTPVEITDRPFARGRRAYALRRLGRGERRRDSSSSIDSSGPSLRRKRVPSRIAELRGCEIAVQEHPPIPLRRHQNRLSFSQSVTSRQARQPCEERSDSTISPTALTNSARLSGSTSKTREAISMGSAITG